MENEPSLRRPDTPVGEVALPGGHVSDVVRIGDDKVVCHNDLAPRNTVYLQPAEGSDRLLPVAFIDWDSAAPGRRVHDLAHLCWQWAGGATSDVVDATRLIRVAADAHRSTDADRDELAGTILWQQQRSWRGRSDELIPDRLMIARVR